MIDDRSAEMIARLAVWFQPKVWAFVRRAAAIGIPVRLTRGVTTQEVQAALYAVGRRALTEAELALLRAERLLPAQQSKVVTHAAGADQTPHGLGLAFDVLPLIGGRVVLAPPESAWLTLYTIAERVGLDALGDKWGEFLSYDKGHFQEPGWRVYRPEKSV